MLCGAQSLLWQQRQGVLAYLDVLQHRAQRQQLAKELDGLSQPLSLYYGRPQSALWAPPVSTMGAPSHSYSRHYEGPWSVYSHCCYMFNDRMYYEYEYQNREIYREIYCTSTILYR